MGIPIRRLQHEISSRDFALYQAYDRIDPFGMERADIAAALICDTLAKLQGVKKTKISDFMVHYEEPPKPKKNNTQIFAVLKMFTRASGGKVN